MKPSLLRYLYITFLLYSSKHQNENLMQAFLWVHFQWRQPKTSNTTDCLKSFRYGAKSILLNFLSFSRLALARSAAIGTAARPNITRPGDNSNATLTWPVKIWEQASLAFQILRITQALQQTRCKYYVGWQHLPRTKDVSFQPAKFFPYKSKRNWLYPGPVLTPTQ